MFLQKSFLYFLRSLLFLTAFITLTLHSASAQEVIHNFYSQIDVSKDGTLTVTEIIRVKAEGRNIKRGIYRDFPLYFSNENGERHRVGFKILNILRDDKPDSYHTKSIRNGIRIYIGKKDVRLKSGVYTYTIKYKTTRQIRFFDSHEELNWNVTGSFWNFPIERASIRVTLPDGGEAEKAYAVTGSYGDTGNNAETLITSDGRKIIAETTTPLRSREGLTIFVKLKKGSINPPTEAQKRKWFLSDYFGEIIVSFIFLIVAAYYFIIWLIIGRDPIEGVIVPRWELDDDLSPALVNYIDCKGLAGKGFAAISAALLNLAVKGYVTLDKSVDGDLLIKRTDKEFSPVLPIGERALLRRINRRKNGIFPVSDRNGKSVGSLQKKFASTMENEHRKKFYKHNMVWVIIGVTLSLIGLGLAIPMTVPEANIIALMVFFVPITFVFSGVFFGILKSLLFAGSLFRKIITLIAAAILTFILTSFCLNYFVGTGFNSIAETWMTQTIIALVMLNILFFYLLGAPTSLGRKQMDKIAGLKAYLTIAEEDRMNLAGAPDFSTQHFEALLPYAVALGVEKPWSQAFETWLATAVAAGAVAATYSPSWYSGQRFHSGNVSDSTSGFSDAMQNSFSSAMPAPKSSSSGFSGGGGGGFSGGGGGGGGGGGW